MQENKTPELIETEELSILLDEISHISEEGLLHRKKIKYQQKIEGLAAEKEQSLRRFIDNSKALTGQQIFLFKEAIFTSNDIGSNKNVSVYFAIVGVLTAIGAVASYGYSIFYNVLGISIAYFLFVIGVGLWQYLKAKKKLSDIKSISQRLYIEIENKKLLLEAESKD